MFLNTSSYIFPPNKQTCKPTNHTYTLIWMIELSGQSCLVKNNDSTVNIIYKRGDC